VRGYVNGPDVEGVVGCDRDRQHRQEEAGAGTSHHVEDQADPASVQGSSSSSRMRLDLGESPLASVDPGRATDVAPLVRWRCVAEPANTAAPTSSRAPPDVPALAWSCG